MRNLVGPVISCVVLLASARANGKDQLPTKEPVGEVRARFVLASAEVTIGEPVVLSFSVRNESNEPLTIVMGAQGRQYFEFNLTLPDGRRISNSSFTATDVVTFGTGTITVAPAGDYTKELVMNQWFSFGAIGTYFISSKLTTTVNQSPYTSAFGPETLRLIVTPRDPLRLERVCQKLTQEISAATNAEEAQQPALKLSYVQDPIAVPYLARALQEPKLIAHLIVPGLQRIGNDAAVGVLLSAFRQETNHDNAELAERALTLLQDRISNPQLRSKVKAALKRD